MGRSARRKSTAGMYHVMLRGINRQQIFMEDRDYRQFIKAIFRFQEKAGYQVHAYCLMENHVHLLMQCKNEEIGDSVRRIANSYVYYYNMKYHRTGHLFENRFRSEAVNDDAYFLTVYRYIIQNPVKAGLCWSIYEYPWSSIILLRKGFKSSLINGYFSSKRDMFEYLEKRNEDKCLDWDKIPGKNRLTDDEFYKIFCNISGCRSIREFKMLSVDEQNKVILLLIELNSNLAQVARTVGVSRYQIAKIKEKIA